jgi:hypothetical protein
LLRKAEKKAGHEELVKLLPSEVSNGVGMGVVTTVTEGAVDVDTPGVELGALVSVLITGLLDGSVSADEVIVLCDEDVDDDEGGVEVEAMVVGTTLSPTCLLSRCMSCCLGGRP